MAILSLNRWRKVVRTDDIGKGERTLFEIRTIWLCTLDCGHTATVTTCRSPLKLQCLACDPVGDQMELPLECSNAV